jgi:class 3 adenylate cyclase
VSVCGLPEPNKYHALKMAKFASSCLDHMTITSKRLERSLGPGTADLALRVGLHSGPTIAGREGQIPAVWRHCKSHDTNSIGCI